MRRSGHRPRRAQQPFASEVFSVSANSPNVRWPASWAAKSVSKRPPNVSVSTCHASTFLATERWRRRGCQSNRDGHLPANYYVGGESFLHPRRRRCSSPETPWRRHSTPRHRSTCTHVRGLGGGVYFASPLRPLSRADGVASRPIGDAPRNPPSASCRRGVFCPSPHVPHNRCSPPKCSVSTIAPIASCAACCAVGLPAGGPKDQSRELQEVVDTDAT